MPRIKAEPKKCVKSQVTQPPNSWVFIVKGEALELSEQYTGTGTPDIVTLRHPNTGESAVFLFSVANNSVQEILTLNENKRSWILDENVKSDGKMQLSTPIDPIFLVLPYLKKYCTNQAIPLEQLLCDDQFPETERLLKCSGLQFLNMVADRKGDDDLVAFKYNEEKTLTWLQKKTERVADILKQKNIHVSSGSAAADTFVKSSRDQVPYDAYLRYAHGIVSKYLVDDLSQKLLKYLKLPEDASGASMKRKSVSALQPDNVKKTKPTPPEEKANSSTSPTTLPPTNVLDLSKPDIKTIRQPIQTSREKARSKAASSSKSITSFFKKT